MSSRFLTLALALTTLLLAALPAAGAGTDTAIWMEQTRREAQTDGYHLVTRAEVQALAASSAPHLILDVRTDYEFRAGHIPGARNMEFDPGDKDYLTPEKKAAFLALLGPDKNLPILIHCRDFRCFRSAIAAKWAVRLGYVNVSRYPGGWLDWSTPPEAPAKPVPPRKGKS